MGFSPLKRADENASNKSENINGIPIQFCRSSVDDSNAHIILSVRSVFVPQATDRKRPNSKRMVHCSFYHVPIESYSKNVYSHLSLR